jgi:uncharacterized phiE125 gp8 family phage protein
MNAILFKAPTVEPVTVSEAKDHLRITTNDEDSLIADLVISCREVAEGVTRRAILTQTWDYYLQQFPPNTEVVLPFGNLQSVTSVKWKATDGTETTLTSGTDYLVELNGEGHGKIVLPYGSIWPPGPMYTSNAITIRFVCGWTTAFLVPYRIKAAIKMLVAEMYENRGESVLGQTVVKNDTVDNLLATYRMWGSF